MELCIEKIPSCYDIYYQYYINNIEVKRIYKKNNKHQSPKNFYPGYFSIKSQFSLDERYYYNIEKSDAEVSLKKRPFSICEYDENIRYCFGIFRKKHVELIEYKNIDKIIISLKNND